MFEYRSADKVWCEVYKEEVKEAEEERRWWQKKQEVEGES